MCKCGKRSSPKVRVVAAKGNGSKPNPLAISEVVSFNQRDLTHAVTALARLIEVLEPKKGWFIGASIQAYCETCREQIGIAVITSAKGRDLLSRENRKSFAQAVVKEFQQKLMKNTLARLLHLGGERPTFHPN